MVLISSQAQSVNHRRPENKVQLGRTVRAFFVLITIFCSSSAAGFFCCIVGRRSGAFSVLKRGRAGPAVHFRSNKVQKMIKIKNLHTHSGIKVSALYFLMPLFSNNDD